MVSTLAAVAAPSTASAGRWLAAPQRLIDPVPAVRDPKIAMNDAGAAAAAFLVEPPAANAGLYVATRAAAAVPVAARPRGFDTAVNVRAMAPDSEPGGWDPDPEQFGSYDVAVDDRGGTTLTWTEATWEDLGGVGGWLFGNVFTAYRPAGGAWQATQLVGRVYSPPSIDTSPLAVRPGGGALLVGDTWVAERKPGTTRFGAPIEAPQFGTGGTRPQPSNQNFNPLRMNATGDIALAWVSGTYEAPTVAVSVLPAGGAWSAPVTLSSGNYPSLAITDGGLVVVGWNENSNSPTDRSRVAVRQPSPSFAAGTWGSPQTLVGTNGTRIGILEASGRNSALLRAWEYPGESLYRFPGGTRESLINRPPPTSPDWKQTDQDRWAENATGRAVVLPFTGQEPAPAITAKVRKPGNSWFDGGLDTVISTTTNPAKGYRTPAVALDGQGNGFVAWQRVIATAGKPDTALVGVSAMDPIAPALGTITVPTTATVGQSIALAASATDRMSLIKMAWDFGDGTRADGAALTHVWTKPGTFTVRVTATDEGGNATTATRTIVVSLPKLDLKPTIVWSTLSGGKTLARRVDLSSVRAGDAIRFSCAGTGCDATANRSLTVGATATTLQVKFGPAGVGLSLSAGSTLTVTATRSGAQSQVVKWTMVAGGAPVRTG